MDINKMDIGQAIDAYRMSLCKDGKSVLVTAYEAPGFDGSWVKEHKPQILAELKARKQAQEDEQARRQSIIDHMDGLADIQAMQDTYARESMQRRRATYGDGIEAPMRRTVTFEQIQEALDAHPMARLWLEADRQSLSRDCEIANLGDAVKEDILSGMDYEQVVARRDQADKDYHARHQWD